MSCKIKLKETLMRFMKDFKYCFFNLLAFIALFACDSNNNFSDYRENILDTSKAEIIKLDSIITQNLNSDTTQNLISSFQHEDSTSKVPLDVNSSFDTHDNRIKGFGESNFTDNLSQYIVGRWLVEKRVGKRGGMQGDQNVFAVYNQDSTFFMEAINISGKWWITDTLLFQKFESSKTFSIDTSIIHVLNDSILEVSESKSKGGHTYTLKKISE